MRHILRLCTGLVLAGAVTTVASAQPSGRLMVYTSQPSSQIAKVVEAFNKAHPKVQVVLYRSGTTEVMNRLQAEFAAGRPQADVVLVADAVATTQLKNDGRLLTYAKAPADKVPPTSPRSQNCRAYAPICCFFMRKIKIENGRASSVNSQTTYTSGLPAARTPAASTSV